MENQIALGVVLFGLLVAPFLAYGVLAYLARRDVGSGRASREETTPSTTQAYPSRTIPGGRQREK
jgi:hypothetical protein